jgi:hypothetical protein
VALRVEEDEDEPCDYVPFWEWPRSLELYAECDPGLPRELPRDLSEDQYLELEHQLVRQCGARRVPPWTRRWPWETRSARTVGAGRRRVHRGVVSTPPLIRHPERFLAFYGLERFAVGHKDGPALSGLLEYIGLSRKQREAFEIREGIQIRKDVKIPFTEVGAALGISHVAVIDRLSVAELRLEDWRATIPAIQPKPYRPAISVRRISLCPSRDYKTLEV